MNKDKFLKELEKKLNILNDNEKKDIINEYRDTISEKVKHGKTEEEAVADFGDMDALVKEILKAYKINPDYNDDDLFEKGEKLIKKGAKKMAEITDNVVDSFKKNDEDISLEMIFEMLIKFLIVLLFLAFLKLPFDIIAGIGESILETNIFPISLIAYIYKFIVYIAYLVACFVVLMLTFKKYISKIKSSKDLDDDIIKKKVKSSEKIEYKNSNKESQSIITSIFKFFVILCVLIPFIFVAFGCYLATSVLIALVIKGFPLVGPSLILLGLSFVFTAFCSMINKVINNNHHNYFFPLIIGLVIFAIGCIMTVFDMFDYEYVNTIGPNKFEIETREVNKKIDNHFYIDDDLHTTIIIDETLKDDSIVIEYSYYKDFIHLMMSDDQGYILPVNIRHKTISKILDLIKDDLKNRKIYNYSDFSIVDVEVRVNSKTSSKVIIKDID